MRHGKKFNHLSRKKAHRGAMLSNMACSLIEHKRINTTVAKAKALRQYVEPLITKSKADNTHSRRMVFRYLKSKLAVNELFREVAPKVAERPGGYLRIIKTGFRLGDAAEMCMVELVDFNDLYTKEEKKKTRRSRRGGGKKKSTSSDQAEATPKAEEKPTEEPKAMAEGTEEKEAPAKPEAKKEQAETEKKEADTKKESTEAKSEPEEKKEESKKEDESKKDAPKAESPKEDKKNSDSDEEKKDDKKGE